MKLTKPDRGWAWAVLGASFGAMVVNGCLGQGIGVVHLALLENFNEDNMRTSLAGSLFAATQSCGGVFAGLVLKKYSCRVATIAGSLVMTAGFVCCAFLDSLDLVILVYGGIVGIGAGLTYTTSIIVIGFNFEEKLNLASGVALSGIGMGVLGLSPVIQEMREIFGNKGFFFIMAGISAHLCIFGTLYFPSQIEKMKTATEILDTDDDIHSDLIRTTIVDDEDVAICSDWTMTKESPQSASNIPACFNKGHQSRNSICKSKSSVTPITNIFRNTPLVMLCFSLFFAQFGIYIMFLNLPNYAVLTGAAPLQGAFLISISGICSMAARILTGLATSGNEVDVALMLFGTVSVMGISTMCFPLYGHCYEGQVLYALFLGLYSGSCFPLLNGLSLRLVGLRHLATAVSIEMFSVGLGILSGPPCAGLLIDSGGTYDQCFVITGFIMLVGALFAMASELFRTRRGSSEISQDTIMARPDMKTSTSING
ncbi:monocarboxylate transporter 12-like [Mizuhopecten yessoensis]|uniref:monocarboxylate transporter 12-like n=1 Tax=Mizuhopecten yessoensis TaxID=6573 RepID=UPI000B45D1BD|nr:monocarboxylate transporter 12-like [Mizuhopecten yessoensis]XP_021361244.1 monocarboxylate transporter 12-like [Mizuhopecten yessoensis]XP_021361245.1 monocarboxylate transporter 12-like [Mizuhopecten yessoensis]XP_021361246.1 monocarboxylate transporter 12-like [Mizuhopecten yessoensis]